MEWVGSGMLFNTRQCLGQMPTELVSSAAGPGRVWSAWGWGSSFWGQKQLSGQQKDLLRPRLPAPGLKEECLTQVISPSLNFSLPILSPFKNQMKVVTSCPLCFPQTVLLVTLGFTGPLQEWGHQEVITEVKWQILCGLAWRGEA